MIQCLLYWSIKSTLSQEKAFQEWKFLLYDSDNEPIGQFETDDEGYIWIRKELPEGKYKLRELEPAEGYISDNSEKTFYAERQNNRNRVGEYTGSQSDRYYKTFFWVQWTDRSSCRFSIVWCSIWNL